MPRPRVRVSSVRLLDLTFMAMDSTATIRALNDALRTLTGEGRIMLTAGIAALPPEEQAAIMDRVFAFADFTPGERSVWRARLRQLRARRQDDLLEDRCLRSRAQVRLARSRRRGGDDARPYRPPGGGVLTAADPAPPDAAPGSRCFRLRGGAASFDFAARAGEVPRPRYMPLLALPIGFQRH